MLAGSEDPLRLAYLLASVFSLDAAREQKLLEAETRVDALRLIHAYLAHEIQVLELRQKIATTARDEMSKEQREYLLRQQMRAIQQELGEKSRTKAEVGTAAGAAGKSELARGSPQGSRARAGAAGAPAGRSAPDYHVTRTYLEFVLGAALEQDHAKTTLDIAQRAPGAR